MKFIVIEGLDGSGKTTQIKLVGEYLKQQGIRSKFIHFPRLDSSIFGDLISRFLRGELGAIDTVDPYLVALIYAGDRNDSASLLRQWMQEGLVILADRYLYSNIAFQCAKLNDRKEKEKLAKWIKHLEYEYNGIPKPDLNLFLNVPFHFTEKSLKNTRKGSDRNYLNGAVDIHEADLNFQEKVREIYLWQVRENEDFEMIDCTDGNENMLPPAAISRLITEKIHSKLILQ